jgi:hypothetical protein
MTESCVRYVLPMVRFESGSKNTAPRTVAILIKIMIPPIALPSTNLPRRQTDGSENTISPARKQSKSIRIPKVIGYITGQRGSRSKV